jgi:hypothetical protein
MIRRSIPFIVCATIAVAFAQPNAFGQSTQGDQDSSVYSAFLDSVFVLRNSDTLLVIDSTLRFRAPLESNRPPESDSLLSPGRYRLDSLRRIWWRRYDAIPHELVRRLEAVTLVREPSTALRLPRPLYLLSNVELRAIFSSGVNGGWIEFARRFPRAKRYSAFSRIAYSPDALTALMYYEYHCGGLCGGGDMVVVVREGDRWRVKQILNLWIS